MFEREYKYFLDHQTELIEKYDGKVVVIVGEELVGVYETIADAVAESVKKYEPGTFMVQEVAANPDDLVEKFHTAVF